MALLHTAARLPMFMTLFMLVASIPLVCAAPQTQPFPDIPFHNFSDFISKTFSSKVSLATVLLVLFSMTENPELLSLHA